MNIVVLRTLRVKQASLFLRANGGFLKDVSNRDLYNFFQFPCVYRREKGDRWMRRMQNNRELISVFRRAALSKDIYLNVIPENDLALEENLIDLYFDFSDFLDCFIRDDITGDTEIPFKVRETQRFILNFVVELFNAGEKKLALNKSRILQIDFYFRRERYVLDELIRVFISTAQLPPEMYGGLPGDCIRAN